MAVTDAFEILVASFHSLSFLFFSCLFWAATDIAVGVWFLLAYILVVSTNYEPISSALLFPIGYFHCLLFRYSTAAAEAQQRPAGGEEYTWQAFGSSPGVGGGDVAITCLSSAGPRRVAVAGSGGKLEVWDVEAACSGMSERRERGGGGAFGPGERGAGLVHRLVSCCCCCCSWR